MLAAIMALFESSGIFIPFASVCMATLTGSIIWFIAVMSTDVKHMRDDQFTGTHFHEEMQKFLEKLENKFITKEQMENRIYEELRKYRMQ